MRQPSRRHLFGAGRSPHPPSKVRAGPKQRRLRSVVVTARGRPGGVARYNRGRGPMFRIVARATENMLNACVLCDNTRELRMRTPVEVARAHGGSAPCLLAVFGAAARDTVWLRRLSQQLFATSRLFRATREQGVPRIAQVFSRQMACYFVPFLDQHAEDLLTVAMVHHLQHRVLGSNRLQ